MNNNDWFNLGRSYYFPAATKMNEAAVIRDAQTKKKKDPETPEVKQKESDAAQMYVKADSAFAQLVRLNPSWPTAYIWRGRANAGMDPKAEKDLAKLQYEKVLSTIKPEEKTTTSKKDAIEAYEYLGYYYVTKKDKAKADEMWNAVKELDPNNEKAKAYFTPPKQPQQPGKQGTK
jgi:tetratricopeptide (TPR) repeat protein